MAVTASGLFVTNFVKVFDATQLAMNLVGDTIKVGMFTNSITPNFDTDTVYGSAPYNANEVSGTGYSAGGIALASKTFTGSSGAMVFDAADSSWTSSTITNARCALIYDTTISSSAVCLVNFGADYSTVSGTFTITWPAGGIFSIDITP